MKPQQYQVKLAKFNRTLRDTKKSIKKMLTMQLKK